jgi:hypothetical protein
MAGQNVSFLTPICWERKDRTTPISRYELPIGGDGEGEAARDISPTGSGAAGGFSTPSSNIL